MWGNFTLSLRAILQSAIETLNFLYSTVILKFPTTALNVCSQLIPPQPFVGEDDTESKIKMFFKAYRWQVFCTESMSFSSCFQYEAIYSMMIWKMMTYGKMTLQERTINPYVYSQWWGQDDLTYRMSGCVNVIIPHSTFLCQLTLHTHSDTCTDRSNTDIQKLSIKSLDDTVLWPILSVFFLYRQKPRAAFLHKYMHMQYTQKQSFQHPSALFKNACGAGIPFG